MEVGAAGQPLYRLCKVKQVQGEGNAPTQPCLFQQLLSEQTYGINSSLYQADTQIHYTEIVEERFINILLTDIRVGDKKLEMSCKKVYISAYVNEDIFSRT